MMRFRLVTHYENSRIDWAAQGIKARKRQPRFARKAVRISRATTTKETA